MPRGGLEVQTDALLHDLEEAMKNASLWSTFAPSTWAMDSAAPFACDRMPFEQWLQFIFMPKVKALMAQALPLPGKVALQPMGQEMFSGNAFEVLVVLGKIDLCFSEQR